MGAPLNVVSRSFVPRTEAAVIEHHPDDLDRIEALSGVDLSNYNWGDSPADSYAAEVVDQLLPAVSAARICRPYVKRTTLDYAPRLSAELGNAVHIKREDQQRTGAYKLRGAVNSLLRLSPADRARSVYVLTAGNHGIGAAVGAQLTNALEQPLNVILPYTAPESKVRQIQAAGANIIRLGRTFGETAPLGMALIEKNDGLLIHPFAGPHVASGGGGAIATEIHEDLPHFNHLVTAVGGGGLLTGLHNVFKVVNPSVQSHGAQYDKSDAMARSVAAGEIVRLENVGRFVDSTAVAEVSPMTLAAGQEVAGFEVVNEEQIVVGVSDLYKEFGSFMETASGLMVAGLRQLVERTGMQGKTLVGIASGRNGAEARISSIIERAAYLRGERALLNVQIPERRGAFRELVRTTGAHNVAGFQYAFRHNQEAHILLTLDTRGLDDKQAVFNDLHNANYSFTDLSLNQQAQKHAQHMVGGPSVVDARHEVLFQVEFPETTGALLYFLDALDDRWACTRFSYGSDYGDSGNVVAAFYIDDADDLHRLQTEMSNLHTAGYRSRQTSYEEIVNNEFAEIA